MTGRPGRGVDVRALAPLALGVLALAVGSAFGWDARLAQAVVTPPPLIRALLVAAAAVGGLALLVAALRRLGAFDGDDRQPAVPTMIRGVRLAFLAVAAFAAAFGWILGHPLPIVIALIVAGVDVIETSFLLLLVTLRRR